ncbi:hypothetical protein Q5692_37810 [Microcoleus sp. C2C3]|uniref:hypothetical protein n=1 Tax=unclassified Microcoleus TaxID=2642155 RepID=UPI002FD1A7C1
MTEPQPKTEKSDENPRRSSRSEIFQKVRAALKPDEVPEAIDDVEKQRAIKSQQKEIVTEE